MMIVLIIIVLFFSQLVSQTYYRDDIDSFKACIEFDRENDDYSQTNLAFSSINEDYNEFNDRCKVEHQHLDYPSNTAFCILPNPYGNFVIDIPERQLIVIMLNNWVGSGILSFWETIGDSLKLNSFDSHLFSEKNGSQYLTSSYLGADDAIILCTESHGGDTGDKWGDIRLHAYKPFGNSSVIYSKRYQYNSYSEHIEFRQVTYNKSNQVNEIIIIEDHYTNIDKSFSQDQYIDNFAFEYSDSLVLNVRTLLEQLHD